MKRINFYVNLFFQLLKTDWLIYQNTIIRDLIDNFIWVACSIFVTTYIFPKLGLLEEYGAFFAIGTIPSCTYFELWSTTANFISDLDGNKTISYPLTLPIPSWLVFVKFALGYALRAMALSIMILPLCKLIMWDKMDLSNISWIQFIIIFIALNVFSGFFAIFMASIVKNMHHIGSVWTRVLFPLWFFGGSQFSWKTMYDYSHTFGYINLLNPLLYPLEGIRSAVFGVSDYISFWPSLLMMTLFGIIFGWIGILKLKKRLDFV